MLGSEASKSYIYVIELFHDLLLLEQQVPSRAVIHLQLDLLHLLRRKTIGREYHSIAHSLLLRVIRPVQTCPA